MAEKLGEAVLELRTDDSALTSGMAQAKAGAQDLDRSFATAGRNVERSLGGVISSGKATGVAATELAVAAQTSARAAMDQASGFGAAASAARVNTLAMRESLVVARELARGNFTRLPGSLSLLAQGIGSQGGIGAFASAMAQQLGLIKQVQNAELAEAATAAANATAGIEAAARIAAAKVMVADTEIALAEAQLRATEGTSAEAASQARLAAAHEAVAAAAAEATIAEDALAVAMGRSAEAGAASAAATRTMIGGSGIGLIGIATVAGVAYGAIKQFQDEVKDSGSLDTFAESLNLTDEQVKKLGGSITYLKDGTREISDLTVSFGDVMHGVFAEIAREANAGGTWDGFKKGATSAFDGVLSAWDKTSASLTTGAWEIANTLVAAFNTGAGMIGLAFTTIANTVIGAINAMASAAASAINGLIATSHALLGTPQGSVGFKPIGTFSDAGASALLAKGLGQLKGVGSGLTSSKGYNDALAAQHADNARMGAGALQHARSRLQTLSDGNRPKKGPKPKKPKQPKRNPADDELAKLTAQIASENELTQAYLTSDAAVIKAQADQKAMTLAVEKHATASQTAALKQKELALAIATIAAEGAKAISNLNADATARTKVNAMVAAGLIPASQANQALQNELALRQQLAALTLAQEDLAEARHANDKKRIAEDIAAIQRLQGIIQGLPVSQAADTAAKNVADAQAQIAANDNEIAQIRLKNALLGDSNKEIATALANLQALQYLKDHPGVDASTAAALTQSYVDKAQASIQTPFQQWAATIPQTAAAIGDALQNDAVKGINDLNDGLAQAIVNGGDLWQVLHQGAASFLVDLIKLAEQEAEMAIFKAIIGASGGSGPSNSGDFFGAFTGGFATGGLIPTSSWGIVGEKGPEPIISTPKGAMVLPNSSLRRGFAANDSGRNVSVTNYNDFRGADAQSVAAMSARVDQMERDLPGRVVSTMSDARSRFIWRNK